MQEDGPVKSEPLEQDPSSSSELKYTVSESPKYKPEEKKCDILEASYKSILNELIDDAILELCFEIHRAAKLGYFFLYDQKSCMCIISFRGKTQIIKDQSKDIFAQDDSKVQNFQVSCPICQQRLCAIKFATHLAKCIGTGGRISSRIATKRIADEVFENFSDFDENDSDFTYNSGRRKTKKGQGKKNARRRPKNQGSSSKMDACATLLNMPYEHRIAFLNQYCGVISKRNNKPCMNTHKCSQHTEIQRREVRHELLRDMGDQLANDGQIDVDTVDEGNDGISFIMQSFPTYPTSSKDISPEIGMMDEKKQSAPTKSTSAYFQKKKTGFGPSNSASSPSQIESAGSSFDSV